MSRLIFQCIALIVLVVMAITGYWEYFEHHQYYETILWNWSNLLLVFWGLVWAAIPTIYLIFASSWTPRSNPNRTYISNPTLRWFFISTLIGLIFYGVCLVSMRWGLYGLWLILLARNTFMLFGLWVFQTLLFLSLGDTVKQLCIPDESRSRQRVWVTLAIWISVQLLLLYVLVVTNLLFPIVSWILCLWWWYLIWKSRKKLNGIWELLCKSIDWLKQLIRSKSTVEKILWWLFVWAILIGFWYIFNGFQLSFMPYTTAWDANHAYMFYPKMWSFNNWIYWFEKSMNISPDLWYMFLTYWFSLFRWTDGIWAVSSDTIVLSLNFWSGIYVLWLGSILVHTFAQFFSRKNIILIVWIVLLLLWLTSGMGAFLVFVDNKTDLWVLSLIIWAIISGFVVLRDLDTENFGTITNRQKKALLLSWFLYAVAALAKPTAMFDVINFAMYLWWILMWSLGVLMIAFLVVWSLTLLEFRGIRDYLPQAWWKWYLWLWALSGMWWLITASRKKIIFGLTVLLIRWGWFAITKIVVTAPYLIGKVVIQDASYTGTEFVKSIFLSKNIDKNTLIAQASEVSLASQCSLSSQWFSSAEELYENLPKASGSAYNEDIVRYVGFWWKWNASDIRRWVQPFNSRWWTWVVPQWCSIVSLNHRDDLKLLCDNHDSLKNFDANTISALVTQVDQKSYHGERLQLIVEAIESGDDTNAVKSRINPILQELLIFVESSTIYKDPVTNDVFLPYKRIIPFNISYNRSLQNLSSYYTDIGIIWLVCLIFSWLGLIYGVIFRKKIVTVSCMVTLVARTLRGLIASGIVWYSIWLIIRSILSCIAFIWSLFEDSDETPLQQILQVLFFAVLGWVLMIQLFLNMARIASQWWNGAFMWYKSSVWKQQILDPSLKPIVKTVTGFDKQDVFDMQFPHYKPFIEAMNEREEGEWWMIAWTYIRYFVKDQSHIKYDAFLTWLGWQLSDNDICNSYLRLVDQKIRYMAIDLNIGTVVQWEGNRSLFDRFFARVNTSTNSIEEEGAISMLIALNQQWYVRYVSSNNIWAKYAFTMPDKLFNGMDGEQLRLFKSRMAVARYFRNDKQLLDSLIQIAQQRVQDGTFVTDIADILGLEIREDLLISLIRANQITQQQIEPLTQYERKALSQYLSFASMQQSDPDQFTQALNQTIQQSINNPNQILSIEIVKN